MTQPQPATVEATFYAQVTPLWARSSSYWNDESGHPHLEGAKVAGITQQRPDRPRPGTVVVKLTLELPAAAFLPLSPEAVVVIPAGYSAGTPIHVVTHDAFTEGRRLAAGVLEEHGLGGMPIERDVAIERMLDEPAYAAEVYRLATAELDGDDFDLGSQIDRAGRALGVTL